MFVPLNYRPIQPDKYGRYGPTTGQRYYLPNPVHNPNKKKSKTTKKDKEAKHKVKTQWVKDPDEQYCIFEFAEVNNLRNNSGYVGVEVINGRLKSVGENGELFAFFPQTRNHGDPWHGYPDRAPRHNGRLDDIFVKMCKNEIISGSEKRRLLGCKGSA